MTPPTTDARVAANVGVLLLAGGSGTRFGGDKLTVLLGGKPLWRWSYDEFSRHPRVAQVVVVGGPHFSFPGVTRVEGGETRQESAASGLRALSPDVEYILIHDAARPFISAETIDAVIDGCEKVGAAAPVVPVVDTLRSKDSASGPVDRSKLIAMQTPQGARASVLRRAHAEAPENFTDEIALIEALGLPWEPVAGTLQNFKITVPEDLSRAYSHLRHEVRNGLGYDVHAFSSDASRPLWLGGVLFEGQPGLEGHSDADVLLHAITDALLGAAALGDIGVHFPPSDPRWRNMSSLTFLSHAAGLLAEGGWNVVHVDAALIAETPKVMPRALEIRSTIAQALGLEDDRVSLKATTNERLGAIGRGEGIAAFATATIERFIR